jgi:hypothetical protein
MPTPTPIPTPYAGRYFRSRLEARWAVFFDALHVPYIYEPETCNLSDRYLPDFWLPVQECFVEIKPTYDPVANDKYYQLANVTDKRILLIQGPPQPKKVATTIKYLPLTAAMRNLYGSSAKMTDTRATQLN